MLVPSIKAGGELIMKVATKIFTAAYVIAIGAATFALSAEAQQYGAGGTQYGPDYQYYGPRNGSRSSRTTRNLGEPSTTGTQYGPDYQYYGPRGGRSQEFYGAVRYGGDCVVSTDIGRGYGFTKPCEAPQSPGRVRRRQ
jgi:hypothetical protein